MKILEFGKPENDRLILIHGFQCPWQIWEDYIDHFSYRYQVIVPILPGHDRTDPDDCFTTFDEAVAGFISAYLDRYGNAAAAIYAISMGGVFAAEIVASGKIKIGKIILESSPLLPFGHFIGKILCRQYLRLTHRVQRHDEKTIVRATETIISPEKRGPFMTLMEHMSDDTIIRYLDQVSRYRMPAALPAAAMEFHYLHGGALSEFFFRKVASRLKKMSDDVHIVVFKGRGHCEDALLHPLIRIELLDSIIG